MRSMWQSTGPPMKASCQQSPTKHVLPGVVPTHVADGPWQVRSSALKGAKEKGSGVMGGKSDELVYPHKGSPAWHQPTETVSEFLKRCPPDRTIMEESCIPWYWVDNPHRSAQPKEQPADELFMYRGFTMLEDYQETRDDLEKKNPGMSKGAITRKLQKDREKLKQQIAELARETHLVSGKVITVQSRA